MQPKLKVWRVPGTPYVEDKRKRQFKRGVINLDRAHPIPGCGHCGLPIDSTQVYTNGGMLAETLLHPDCLVITSYADVMTISQSVRAQTTVAGLIALLQTYPPDAPVEFEGNFGQRYPILEQTALTFVDTQKLVLMLGGGQRA